MLHVTSTPRLRAMYAARLAIQPFQGLAHDRAKLADGQGIEGTIEIGIER